MLFDQAAVYAISGAYGPEDPALGPPIFKVQLTDAGSECVGCSAPPACPFG